MCRNSFLLSRWYIQLPTQKAHQYHEMETSCLLSSPSHFSVPLPEEEEVVRDENCALPSRLHPQVAEKIRDLVSQGVEQVYAVRKQLRYRTIWHAQSVVLYLLLHLSNCTDALPNIFPMCHENLFFPT